MAQGQTALGKYNNDHLNALLVIGNGSAANKRSNIVEVTTTDMTVYGPVSSKTYYSSTNEDGFNIDVLGAGIYGAKIATSSSVNDFTDVGMIFV
jgi:hypothetical protein